jgi:anti-sigma factor (TIGR02949 family)
MTKQIDCEQALRQIFEFIDHELGDSERKVMQHHLHTCKSCFSRMEFERRLKEKLGALREEQASPEIGKRVKDLLKGF